MHSSTNTSHETAPFDPQQLLELVGPDFDLIRQLAMVFAEDAPRLLDGIRTAVTERDPANLMHAAHSLKGAAATLGANKVSSMCLEIERVGRAGKAEVPHSQLELLEAELLRLNEQLLAYASTLPGGTS